MASQRSLWTTTWMPSTTAQSSWALQDKHSTSFLTLDPATSGFLLPPALFGSLPAEPTTDTTAPSPQLIRKTVPILRSTMALEACLDSFPQIPAVLLGYVSMIRPSLRQLMNLAFLLLQPDLTVSLGWASLRSLFLESPLSSTI